MARYRTYTIEFKRQLVEEHLGGVSLTGPARRHDISREPLRVRVGKCEAGEFASDGPAESARRACGARIAGLERKAGRLTTGLDLPEMGPNAARRARGGTSSVVSGPRAAASGRGAASRAWRRAPAAAGPGPSRPGRWRPRPARSRATARPAPGSRATATVGSRRG